ncbi:heterochromatin protein 1J-like protein [Dinothrombium tinctorium]|uniref:Heterochromatin protein 1J-like protein n=1 Tax=Dinothrombium tinctorium TaxID=1965070 RepID=A0A3S3PW34_9ACAR|nr:heterochromatin protein 1J-like protein [Dinothrombium tinctorium]RWR99642.1 heterochromatin protein 1J-like protein [Dinothrombium tinctorium]RWS02369.1 heterochromatin protein 1J-like protein [Dinothrombium tinctorium]
MKMGENGFDRGWTAKEILAATVRDGRHEFLITWNNQNKVEAIPASIANEKCPQLVIAFYESRLTWKEPTHKKPK